MVLFDLNDCIYTSCYCEENVWKLCEKLRDEGRLQQLQDVSAIFISNDAKKIPLWEQKCVDEGQVVVWDYHVILVHQEAGAESQVYDLDTRLPFPCRFKYYLEMALRTEDHMKETYHRKFRVVSGAVFLDTFASDRKHMKGPDGLWLKPPPMYPCISTKASSNNLADFITMVPSVGVGDVINLNTLVHRFSS
ncbi:protein N-terminal glutamine amidohydrolase-like isoform X1 [Anneissia japonica]|uniref:protein N-terminal glutamine amidohydrolase-like isoform X1 n=1 Tax=Anneissia japonica TaxID=1529436 RepID=UPI001425ACFC|nr:protein N-terminal glutamine amidohydrolase-like isoform X1 [Anneissia japonica]